MSLDSIFVGQHLCLAPTGNNARRRKNCTEGIVTRVGRQYFYVDVGRSRMIKVNLETNIEENDGNPDWIIFESYDAYCENGRFDAAFKSIRSLFEDISQIKSYSFEQLVEVARILNIELPPYNAAPMEDFGKDGP